MIITDRVFEQERAFVEPANLYDISRYRQPIVETAITYTMLPSGVWVQEYNGTTGFCDFTGNPALRMGTGDWSASAWIYIIATPANYAGIITFYGDGIVYRTDGQLGLLQDDNMVIGAGAAWEFDRWWKIDAIRTGVTYIVYRNAVNVNSLLTQVGYGIANSCFIGQGNATSRHKGMLALPVVVPYLLTHGQIRNNFEKEKYLFGVL